MFTFCKARWARWKKRKEKHATKVTKIPKTKTRKYGMNETIETSIIPWDETEVGFNDYNEKFVCGTLKAVRYRFHTIE